MGCVWLIHQLVQSGKGWQPREKFCLSPRRNFDFRKRFSFLVTTLSLKPRPNKVNGKKSCHFINYLEGETKLSVSFLHSFLRSRILSKWCLLNLEAFEETQHSNSCTFLSSPSLSGWNCHRGKLEGEGFKKWSGVSKDGSCSNATKVNIHVHLSLSFYLCPRGLNMCAALVQFFCAIIFLFSFFTFFRSRYIIWTPGTG